MYVQTCWYFEQENHRCCKLGIQQLHYFWYRVENYNMQRYKLHFEITCNFNLALLIINLLGVSASWAVKLVVNWSLCLCSKHLHPFTHHICQPSAGVLWLFLHEQVAWVNRRSKKLILSTLSTVQSSLWNSSSPIPQTDSCFYLKSNSLLEHPS